MPFHTARGSCTGALHAPRAWKLRLYIIAACILSAGTAARAADPEFYVAADISALTSLEQAGAVYKDNGKPMDAIQIFRNHGYNLFRVRIFVDPAHDYAPVYGAVQDMAYVKAIAKRIKASGALFSLDIHYSDFWADPGHQNKPKAWANLSGDALVQKVHDYTADVMKQLADNGTPPDWVQIGNEITNGMIWPDGQLYPPGQTLTDAQKDERWTYFSRLLGAGASAVRAAQTPDHRIRVVIHIDNGGKAGTPQYFFGKLMPKFSDFDVIGLSFYPEWGGSMTALKANMADIIHSYHKDVILAETSYFWKPDQLTDNTMMTWPETPAGQAQFTREMCDAVRAAPEHRGIGFIWWFPEAIQADRQKIGSIWRNGADALFDDQGNALTLALDAWKPGSATQP